MTRRIGCHAALLISLVSLAACESGQQHTERLLDYRLHDRLGVDVSAGRAVVEKVPGGDRVTLLGPSSFPSDKSALDDQTPDVRANVIEGLLDPSLMRVQLADSAALPANQRETRVANVSQFFTANGLGGVLVPADAATPAGPAGLAITILLQCPQRDWRTGYGDGKSRPVCD
jgi:hypothetical protein